MSDQMTISNAEKKELRKKMWETEDADILSAFFNSLSKEALDFLASYWDPQDYQGCKTPVNYEILWAVRRKKFQMN